MIWIYKSERDRLLACFAASKFYLRRRSIELTYAIYPHFSVKMAHTAVISRGKAVTKIAKPLLSTNEAEARLRILNLYRAWMREVGEILFISIANNLFPELYSMVHSIIHLCRPGYLACIDLYFRC